MVARKQFSTRLSEQSLSLVSDLADDSKLSPSALVDGLLGRIGAVRRLLIGRAEEGGTITAFERLLADAVRYRMEHESRPISREFFGRLTPNGVLLFAQNWLDAINDAAGLPDRDGLPSKFRLAQVPAGGAWERRGAAGKWGVLDRAERFTADDVEYVFDAGDESWSTEYSLWLFRRKAAEKAKEIERGGE